MKWTNASSRRLSFVFKGGPVGISSLAVSVGEESGTVEEVNEPYLIQEGFIKRTAQGRVAMPKAYEKLGMQIPPNRQGELYRRHRERAIFHPLLFFFAFFCGARGGVSPPAGLPDT